MQLPALLTSLRGYDARQALSDVSAGLIVAVVALPLAIAFAIASGLTPAAGLYTAIVAGFLISALGGSNVQIGGPTGAFVVIVYGIVQAHGPEGLALATIMAGGLLVVLGVAGLGAAIKFIPYPVTTGFTSGIAVVILSGQIPDLLGLRLAEVPPEFLARWASYATNLGSTSGDAVLVSGVALAFLVLWPRVSRKVPSPMVALLASAALVPLLGLDVETIGSRFGEVSARPPGLSLPVVTPELLVDLSGPALAIALLAAVESLLSAVVADGMTGGRHRSNVELVAQGVANIASPLFGGMPATGAIARTATNIRNGGRTPVAGMTHAVALLLITLFFGRWVSHVPLASLAAILVVVAYHMSEWRSFVSELRAPRSDVAVLLVTFLLTVFVDLVVAIEVGMVLAAFLFMRRMAEVTNVSALRWEGGGAGEGGVGEGQAGAGRGGAVEGGGAGGPLVPDDVRIYEIDGPFFFGAAEKFNEAMHRVEAPPRALVLVLHRVPAMDSTALHALRTVIRRARKDGTRVSVVGVHAQPMMVMARAGLVEEIGDDDLFGSVELALAALAPGAGAPPLSPAWSTERRP